MFWILNSKSSVFTATWQFEAFPIILAYCMVAYSDISSDFAPVQTILPLAKIRAVVFGSLILMIAAANLFGLYSTFLAF